MDVAKQSVISVRAVAHDDRDFLFDLFCAVRAPEFALLVLPDQQKEQLLKFQCAAQQSAYRAQYPGSDYAIVLRDNEPIGRIWIVELEHEFHLVDIALLPDARKAGIGTFLIKQLQWEAKRAGKLVRSNVFRFNPGSLRWHQGLGFRITAEDAVQFHMEWTPAESAIVITT